MKILHAIEAKPCEVSPGGTLLEILFLDCDILDCLFIFHVGVHSGSSLDLES